jgi:hypothetical protein
MDGAPFQEITGYSIGDQNMWNSLAHNEMFVILNLAVGGDWVSQSPDLWLKGQNRSTILTYLPSRDSRDPIPSMEMATGSSSDTWLTTVVEWGISEEILPTI